MLHALGRDRALEPPGDADCTAVIKRHAAGCDLVILGGGDGTMNAAAPALVETGLPLGVLPLGTANDLARSLDIPLEPVAAATLITTEEARPADLGWVNGHYYFNVASIGFSAELAGGPDRRIRRSDGGPSATPSRRSGCCAEYGPSGSSWSMTGASRRSPPSRSRWATAGIMGAA